MPLECGIFCGSAFSGRPSAIRQQKRFAPQPKADGRSLTCRVFSGSLKRKYDLTEDVTSSSACRRIPAASFSLRICVTAPTNLMLPLRRIPLLLGLAGLVLCGLMAVGGSREWGSGTGSRADASAVAHRLLHALVDVDYRAFLEPAGGNFKKLPEDTFLRLVVQHGARLRQGYELQPIDTTTRRDVEMTKWRVVFASGGKDATLTLGMHGGTVRLFTLW
jgi:hypothetical protein